MSHRQQNMNRPKSRRGRPRPPNFEDDRAYAFSASSNRKKRQSPALPSLQLQSADMTSTTVLEAPVIKQKHQKRTATTRNNKASSGNFLAQAKNAQGDVSPDFQNTFLSQGLDNENNDNGGGHEKPTGFMASTINRVSNIIFPKQQHSFSSPYSTKKKRSKQKDQLDTLTALPHSPLSSPKKKKSKEQVVVDLVDDDSNTDDEPVRKPSFRHAAESTTTRQTEEKKERSSQRNTVYDTITGMNLCNRNQPEQRPSLVSKTKYSPSKHALHDSSEDSDTTMKEETKVQKRNHFNARVEEKQHYSKAPFPANFSTAPAQEKETAFNQAAETTPQKKKEDSDDSDDNSSDSGTYLPNAQARPSKSTPLLQKAQVAAKTRRNPDLMSMQQTNLVRTTTKAAKEVISVDDDDDAEEDGRQPPDAASKHAYSCTMMDKPIPRRTFALPPDLCAPAIKETDGGLLQGYDHGTSQWKSVGTPTGNDHDARRIKQTTTKQQEKRSKRHTPANQGNDDDGDFWSDAKGEYNETQKSFGRKDDSWKMRSMAESQEVNDDDDNKVQAYTVNRVQGKLKEKQSGTKQQQSGRTTFLRGINPRGRNMVRQAQLELTKTNHPKRKATKVVPGRSTLASANKGTTKSSSPRMNHHTTYGTTASRYFDSQSKGESDWGGASTARVESAPTRKRKSNRLRAKADTDDEYDLEMRQDASITSSRRRMSNRLVSKKASRQDETIVLSSDSEGEGERASTKLEYELLRISIGKKVFNNGCHLTFQPKTCHMKLRFYKSTRTTVGSLNTRAKQEELNMRLTQETLKVVKVYSTLKDAGDDDSDFSFLAMKILPSQETNDLSRYSSSYRPKAGEPGKLQYIVLEFRADDDHAGFCKKVATILAPMIGAPGLIDHCKRGYYAEALIEHSRKTLKHRQRYETQSSFTEGRDGESILLVYPFAGDTAQIDAAAEGLREASGRILTNSDDLSSDDDVVYLERCASKLSAESNSDTNGDEASSDVEKAEVKVKVRQTYVTIRVKDYEGLDPEEWLNDSLVDFWMQWISRGEDKTCSNLHFFTSHFYTTLLNDGPESVTSWTAKKNINIFEKKFIFIPINKDLHWSLCVVVNPGSIKNSLESDLEKKAKLNLPCLIFMDSLSLHKKATVRKKVETWLNSEYCRIHPDEALSKPFSKNSFELFTPGVPKQNNTWDCGVFVCRYAYAIYHLRNRPFSYGAVHERTPFSQLITGGTEFDFDMRDIVRFRGEFKKLVENLSQVYCNWKREEQTKPKTASEVDENDKPRKEEQPREDGSEQENITIAPTDPSLSPCNDAGPEKMPIDLGDKKPPARPGHASPARSMAEQEADDSSTSSIKASSLTADETDCVIDVDDDNAERGSQDPSNDFADV